MGLGIMTKIKNGVFRVMIPNNVIFRSPISFNRMMRFCGKGYIELGGRSRNRGNVVIESIRKESRLIIGSNVFFNRNDMIVCMNKIVIGDNCMFGPNVYIYDHDHCFTKERVYPYEYQTCEVLIGNNVWCGANVVILRGTVIGDGAVIGAGTVVKGIIPPHSIVHASDKLVIRPIMK